MCIFWYFFVGFVYFECSELLVGFEEFEGYFGFKVGWKCEVGVWLFCGFGEV